MEKVFSAILLCGSLFGAGVCESAMVTTVGAGTAVSSATNAATFDNVVTGTDLTNYIEDGLRISLPDTAYRFNYPGHGTKAFSGGFHYASGGAYAFSLISAVSDRQIFGLEFTMGSGWGNLSNALYWQTKVGGIVTGSGILTPMLGSVVGFADLSGFQTLELGLYANLSDAQSVNGIGGYKVNALALDNLFISTQAPSAAFAAVPEPSTALFGLAMMGAVAFCRRRIS